VGFEPTISAGEWPQTYALDRAATGTTQQLTNSRREFHQTRYLGKVYSKFVVMSNSVKTRRGQGVGGRGGGGGGGHFVCRRTLPEDKYLSERNIFVTQVVTEDTTSICN
jgi:hypothetical protein